MTKYAVVAHHMRQLRKRHRSLAYAVAYNNEVRFTLGLRMKRRKLNKPI